MINFLEEKYCSKASSSQVSQDGYEASNLIKCKTFSIHKQTGFLAEYFIKPPVEVTFIFPISVEVSFVQLGLRVGAQTTDGIEILVTNTSDNNENAEFQSVYRQCPIEKGHLILKNFRFRPRAPFNLKTEDFEHSNSDTLKGFFKCSHHLHAVRQLKVRIIKTSGSSVPALGSVKVWGQPARSCQPHECARIFKLYTTDGSFMWNEDDSDDDVQILETPSPEKNHKNQQLCMTSSSAIVVPEEFLDPLTLEVMALPMLLPSGQSVDRSTLEKFTESQASWGRPPSDPFTGILFGPGRQPVTNAHLKARVDSFLIKNAHLDPQLAKVPRTSGLPKMQDLQDILPPPVGLPKLCTTTAIVVNTQSKTSQLQERSIDNFRTNPASISAHQKALDESLQLALNSCLKTTFSGSSRRSDKNKVTCVGCDLTDAVALYKLYCQHHLCRSCLLKAKDTCPDCNRQFHRREVSRSYSVPN